MNGDLLLGPVRQPGVHVSSLSLLFSRGCKFYVPDPLQVVHPYLEALASLAQSPGESPEPSVFFTAFTPFCILKVHSAPHIPVNVCVHSQNDTWLWTEPCMLSLEITTFFFFFFKKQCYTSALFVNTLQPVAKTWPSAMRTYCVQAPGFLCKYRKYQK